MRQPRESATSQRSCPWCDLATIAVALLCALNPAAVPLWMLGAFPLIALVRLLLTGRIWTRTPIDWPLAIICLMGLVSLGITALPEVTHDAFVYLVAGAATLTAALEWSTSPKRLTCALLGFGIVGFGLVMLSPLVARLLAARSLAIVPQAPDQLKELFDRGATAVNPNILGGAMALIIPILLAFALRRPPSRRALIAQVAAGMLLLALSLAAALTHARGAYVGVATGCAVVAFLTERRSLWLVPIGIAAILIGIWQIGWPNVVDWILSTGANTSLEGRLEVWSRALYMLQDFPFTGVGMGAFNQVANILYPFFLVGPDTQIPHAHNLFLQVGVDLGLPGLIAYLALLGLCTWMALDVCRTSRRLAREELAPQARAFWALALPLSIGLLGGQVALIAHGLLDAATWGVKPALLAWAMWGLTAGLWRLSLAEESEGLHG